MAALTEREVEWDSHDNYNKHFLIEHFFSPLWRYTCGGLSRWLFTSKNDSEPQTFIAFAQRDCFSHARVLQSELQFSEGRVVAMSHVQDDGPRNSSNSRNSNSSRGLAQVDEEGVPAATAAPASSPECSAPSPSPPPSPPSSSAAPPPSPDRAAGERSEPSFLAHDIQTVQLSARGSGRASLTHGASALLADALGRVRRMTVPATPMPAMESLASASSDNTMSEQSGSVSGAPPGITRDMSALEETEERANLALQVGERSLLPTSYFPRALLSESPAHRSPPCALS